ncbi:MAG: hypothetical protein JWN51_1282, partial [Phycisphaerales bacterium]|nr:hypothetical protein [Phycisphaerales bacterium]
MEHRGFMIAPTAPEGRKTLAHGVSR